MKCILCTVKYIVFSLLRTLYTVQYTVSSMMCKLYTVHYSVNSVKCKQCERIWEDRVRSGCVKKHVIVVIVYSFTNSEILVS